MIGKIELSLSVRIEYVSNSATGSTGGTFLITGPNWNGQVPNGMHEIKTPTNIAWISNRIFVNGTSDLPNVHAIQNQIKLVPLSVFQGNATSAVSPSLQSLQAAIKASDKTPNPAMIPAVGIKVYDAISQAMVGNPQTYPPPDPQLLAKFASIGIGHGKTPSKEAATNSTLNAAIHYFSEEEFGPGDVGYLPPGHIRIIGNEPCVAIDFTGMKEYAKK